MWVSGEAVHVEESSIQEISALSAQFFCEPKTALKITNKHIQTLQQTKPSNKQNPPTNKTLQQLFISCRLKAKVFARAYKALYDLSLSILGPLCPHPCFSHTSQAYCWGLLWWSSGWNFMIPTQGAHLWFELWSGNWIPHAATKNLMCSN